MISRFRVFVCSWLLIIANVRPAAAQQTFTGRLSDSACAASHQSKSAADGLTDRDCIFACLKALGAFGLAGTATPASDVMRVALGEAGARIIAVGIAVSTLGFLSQSMLTAPRVYYAMAEDGLFFRSVAWLHPRTRAPVVAIAVQGALAMLIAVSGRYEQILSYVVSADWIFFGLTASCLFVLRRRDAEAGGVAGYRVPGHPFTTAGFVAVSALVVANTLYKYPADSGIGLAILLAGVPAYFASSAARRRPTGGSAPREA